MNAIEASCLAIGEIRRSEGKALSFRLRDKRKRGSTAPFHAKRRFSSKAVAADSATQMTRE